MRRRKSSSRQAFVANAVAGKFALDGQGLRVTDGAQQARVLLPIDPMPAEYDLQIAVGRLAPGGKAFVIGVPWQGSQVCVVVDGFSNSPFSGLEFIDGQNPKVNGTENPGEKITFGPRSHKLIVRVRTDGIAAECDGKPLFEWQGKPAQLSTHAMWSVPRKYLPFLGFQGPYVVHSVELLPFVAKTTPWTATPHEAKSIGKESDPCDVHSFHEALKGFNVAGIFHGHTHFREIFRRNGLSKRATSGFNVFNTDNASHFAGAAQAFFYIEMDDRQLVVREYMTRDAWQTGTFTPQVWTAPFSVAKGWFQYSTVGRLSGRLS